MKRSIPGVGALVVLAMLLGACAVPATPSYDAKFGEAVRQAQALQTLNPEAGKNTDPVTGIDGRSGAAAIDRYQESFRSPPKSFDALGIGGELQGSTQ